MPVAKGVDVENIGIRRLDKQELGERGEHMPRIKVHERRHKVESIGGGESNNDDSGTGGIEECAKKFLYTIIDINVGLVAVRHEGFDH